MGPLRDWITEEAVVTVVCAEQLREGHGLEGTFTEQVECADLILLHKLDLLPDLAEVPALTARLQQLNPGVAVLSATRGQVDPRVFLGQLPAGPRSASPAPHPHTHPPLSTEVVTVAPGQTAEMLEAWALSLGELRVKGLVAGPRAGEVLVVQGVGRRCEVVPWMGPATPPVGLVGRVVVIRSGMGYGARHSPL